uniref:Adenylate kinase n=1 Tax=Peronospora matthiolae TaxID=2874970 RepID=A0AAV1U837_9STRA
MGKKVKAAMESGALVTDAIVVGIIKDAIKSSECRCAFILEDFPRAVVQAKKLDEILTKKNTSVDAVVIINVPEKVLVIRIAGNAFTWLVAAVTMSSLLRRMWTERTTLRASS